MDTLHSIEFKLSREELERQLGSFRENFAGAAEAFIRTMFTENADKELMDWIILDMSSAPKKVAISAFSELMGKYVAGELPETFDTIKVPVRCINSDMWPTDVEGNRRHLKSFEVYEMKGVGHFLMMEKPGEFNRLLEKAIVSLDR